MIKLYKVTIECQKEWMSEPVKLRWACNANSCVEAIQFIKEQYDLGGVEIVSESAVLLKEGFVVL